jgi:acetyl esterase/lipase
VVFWTVPGPAGAERPLLCDLWQPPAGVEPTGLAFIYLHNSFWHFFDKDVQTRPFFRHLAGQGHVVMDVAYRLCPEVGIREMVGDVKRAIAWMKAHAAEYGVDPERVVVAGASAGGHLALLAAYAPDLPELTPADLTDAQTSVRAVVSYYGITDIRVFCEYAGAAFGEGYLFGKPKEDEHEEMGVSKDPLTTQVTRPKQSKAWWDKYFYPITFRQIMKNLLGGQPDEVPHMYDLASPVEYVGAHCPPTLLFQGEHDDFVKAEAVRAMYEKLREAGVPAVYVEFPQTEHGFDLFLPRYSPATQAALYDLDRFLGLMAALPTEEAAQRERQSGSLQPHVGDLE